VTATVRDPSRWCLAVAGAILVAVGLTVAALAYLVPVLR
jgi:hypothetical protein